MTKKKEPRYFFSVIEEGVMNPKFKGYRGGRIEIYDKRSKTGFAIDEVRFLIPEEFIDGFRELFDFKYSDKPIMIKWDMFEYPSEQRRFYGKS